VNQVQEEQSIKVEVPKDFTFYLNLAKEDVIKELREDLLERTKKIS